MKRLILLMAAFAAVTIGVASTSEAGNRNGNAFRNNGWRNNNGWRSNGSRHQHFQQRNRGHRQFHNQHRPFYGRPYYPHYVRPHNRIGIGNTGFGIYW